MIFWLKATRRKLFKFDTIKWVIRGFNSPAPQWVKMRFLKSNMLKNSFWIETGTYLGDTSASLSKRSKHVITIEPSKELHEFSKRRHRTKKNITHLLGTSELKFEHALGLVGNRVNIWLDGHHSGDVTFKGTEETPLLHELEVIQRSLSQFQEIIVFVDDVKSCFHSSDSHMSYPPLEQLIVWAVKNGGKWSIDQDIFVVKFSK